MSESTGANQINRRDLTREVAVNANVHNARPVRCRQTSARRWTAWSSPGYRYQFGGSTKNMAESFGYAISALVMAIIFIYMILASQFKAFAAAGAHDLAALTLIGVVLALLMFRSTLSMFSIIGVVMLMGLVTKNAILLVDFAIRAREEHNVNDAGQTVPGLPRAEALLLAAACGCAPS